MIPGTGLGVAIVQLFSRLLELQKKTGDTLDLESVYPQLIPESS